MMEGLENFAKDHSPRTADGHTLDSECLKESDKQNEEEICKNQRSENETKQGHTNEYNGMEKFSELMSDSSVAGDVIIENNSMRSDRTIEDLQVKVLEKDRCHLSNKNGLLSQSTISPHEESSLNGSVENLKECDQSLSRNFIVQNKDEINALNSTKTVSSMSQGSSHSVVLEGISLSMGSTKDLSETSCEPQQTKNSSQLYHQSRLLSPPPSLPSVSDIPPHSPSHQIASSVSHSSEENYIDPSVQSHTRKEVTRQDSISYSTTAAVTSTDENHSISLDMSISSSPDHANFPDCQLDVKTNTERENVLTLREKSECSVDSDKLNCVDLESRTASTKAKTATDQMPCRILTQYVFINRPHKKKPAKKKIGVLYRQGFRHFQRAKLKFSNLSGKVTKNKREEKKEIRNNENEREERLKKRNILKDSIKDNESDDDEKSNNKRRSKQKKKLESKSKKKDLPENAAWKNSKKAERSRQKVPKAKSTKRRQLDEREKVDVINALKLPGATIQLVSAEFGIAKTIVCKLSKEINPTKEAAGKKKVAQEVIPVVKEETPENLLCWEWQDPPQGQINDTENKQTVLEIEDDDVSIEEKTNNRIRKELTLDQKVMVIHDLQKSGSKVTHVAKKYGISSSSVSRLNKHKHSILFQAESGDVCRHMKRTRDCKAPELDRALLKWYRTLEGLCDHPISIPNVLLREKSHEIASAMGCMYKPTTNWILRWKYRHNVVCKQGRIESREDLDPLDKNIDLAEIISSINGQMIYPGGLLLPNNVKEEKPDELFVCEHCGVIVQGKKSKKRTIHLKECPLHAHRRDLTLGEKVKVVRALEKPGVKMVHLAKKFSISTSAISRIHKDKIDILARYNEGYINMDRKRSRVSKEPEVEKVLCDWYRMQQDLGIHISSYMVREKAKEIATQMGKDFSPSDSWVFRWRHRNNVNGPIEYEEVEEDAEEGQKTEQNHEANEETKPVLENGIEQEENGIPNDHDKSEIEVNKKRKLNDEDSNEPKKKRFLFPRSVMCEKCGCVSVRLKNNRIRNMRHSKGCPLLKPRNEMTYEARIKMLHELEEPGATLSSVARKYGVSTSSMSRMNQNKDLIMNQGQERGSQKRIRDCKEPEVAKQLYAWYLEKQAEGIHVTGTKLKEKASKMAKEEGRDFKVSTGWLGRWKNRYNILFKQQDGKDKVKKEGSKRKTSKKSDKREMETEEAGIEFAHLSDMNNISVGDVTQAIQTPGMFLTQHYHQNPWDLAQQASTSCARPKSFIATVGHSIPAEENHGAYSYDHISSRHMFHHTFETFALNGYSVGMGVGTDNPLTSRDFLQQEEEELLQHGVGISPSSSIVAAVTAPSTSSHHSHPLLHHPAPNTHLSQPHPSRSLLNHHHHRPPQPHLPLHHQHTPSLVNIQQQQQQQHSSSPSVVVPEEEVVEQDSQVMEALKIMSSFAQKKSLGADVQAALRTIEMTMKGASGGGGRKNIKKNTYTNI